MRIVVYYRLRSKEKWEVVGQYSSAEEAFYAAQVKLHDPAWRVQVMIDRSDGDERQPEAETGPRAA